MKKKSETTSSQPVMTLLDVLGRRWSLRVLWELRDGPLSFRELRAAASQVSPSVLNTRLTELRELGIVDHDGDGYALTDAGRELAPHLLALARWARAHL